MGHTRHTDTKHPHPLKAITHERGETYSDQELPVLWERRHRDAQQRLLVRRMLYVPLGSRWGVQRPNRTTGRHCRMEPASLEEFMMANGRPWTPEHTATLKRMARAGWSDGAIAEHLRRDRSFIVRKRQALGIECGISPAVIAMLARLNLRRRMATT